MPRNVTRYRKPIGGASISKIDDVQQPRAKVMCSAPLNTHHLSSFVVIGLLCSGKFVRPAHMGGVNVEDRVQPLVLCRRDEEDERGVSPGAVPRRGLAVCP